MAALVGERSMRFGLKVGIGALLGGVTLLQAKFEIVNYITFGAWPPQYQGERQKQFDQERHPWAFTRVPAPARSPERIDPVAVSAVTAAFARANNAMDRLSMTDEQAKARCKTGDHWEIDRVPGAIHVGRLNTVTLRQIMDVEFMSPVFKNLVEPQGDRVRDEIQAVLSSTGAFELALGINCAGPDLEVENNIRRSNLTRAKDATAFGEQEIVDRLLYLLR